MQHAARIRESLHVPRRIQVAVACAIVAFACFGAKADAAPAPPIFVNGTPVAVAARQRHGRVFVPVRGVFERLGAAVNYAPGRVTVSKAGVMLVRLRLHSKVATVRGATRRLEAAPFTSGGRIFVPLRLISEAAGARVAYTHGPRAIRVTSAVAHAPVVAHAKLPAAAAAAAAAPVAAASARNERRATPWLPLLLLALAIAAVVLFVARARKPEAVIRTRSSIAPAAPTRR